MTTRVRVSQTLAVGDSVEVDEGSAHHLTRVLRLSPGAAVEVVDGAGGVWTAILEGEGAPTVRVTGAVEASAANPRVQITVWLPLLKGGKADDLVRQLTELGVARVVPYLSRRSVVKLDDAKAAKRVKRWQTIADEATRQCRRTDRVAVGSLRRGMPRADEGPGVFFYEGGGLELGDLRGPAVTVLIGPEGGLALDEVGALQGAGFRRVSLGARILRAETAVVAATTLVLAKLGEFLPDSASA